MIELDVNKTIAVEYHTPIQLAALLLNKGIILPNIAILSLCLSPARTRNLKPFKMKFSVTILPLSSQDPETSIPLHLPQGVTRGLPLDDTAVIKREFGVMDIRSSKSYACYSDYTFSIKSWY